MNTTELSNLAPKGLTEEGLDVLAKLQSDEDFEAQSIIDIQYDDKIVISGDVYRWTGGMWVWKGTLAQWECTDCFNVVAEQGELCPGCASNIAYREFKARQGVL